jgi:hypothetical protein
MKQSHHHHTPKKYNILQLHCNFPDVRKIKTVNRETNYSMAELRRRGGLFQYNSIIMFG